MADSRLLSLTRADAKDSPFEVTPLNIEIATAYALRHNRKHAARARRSLSRMDHASYDEAVIAAVMLAAQRYNPENAQGASWFTYAHSQVGFAILEESRRQYKEPFLLSIETVSWRPSDDSSHPGSQIRVEDQMGGADDTQADLEMRELMTRLLTEGADAAGLTDRERQILHLRYVAGVRQRRVAKHFGLSAGRIHQIEDEAIGKLKAAVGHLREEYGA